MNLVRTHRVRIAWMLFAFILFNGLVCSFGHGQMLAGLANKASPVEHAGMQHGAMHHGDHSAMPGMAHSMDMSSSLKSLSGDCAFAGTLPLALVCFVALAWLLRSRRAPVPCLPTGCTRPPRAILPTLNPQAP
ncbi:DUF2946 domain-containing protein [Pseudomonas sp. nanlin1]|uniref:DUF2946 domain-containing protein n=1 Tax=Pseudomonas sp. nanlin1 TaxID=3040605 RepID=UPI00388E3D29